jgi:hypothetical protein
MSTLLPVPTLDHVVINVRDRMDEGQVVYERLGFTLTPRGYHTLGSMNHLAMLGTHYFELIAAGPGKRTDLVQQPFGLNGLVFGAEDASFVHDALAASGVDVLSAQQFSRPVTLAGETRDAAFRTVHLAPAPIGRLYFCQHLTRDLVWRDAWRRHANGAIGISRFVIAALDSSRLAGLFGRMFGADAVRKIPGGHRLLAELVDIDIITPDAVHEEFGTDAGDTRDEYMAGFCLRVGALETTARALSGIAHERRGDRLVVAPAEAMGTILAFHE